MINERRSPVQFTQESAQRIARVVRGVETTSRPAKPLSFDPQLSTGGGSGRIKLGTFQGPWLKNTAKTVTLLNVTSTVTVSNVFANVASSQFLPRKCAFTRYNGIWYLIAAEC